MLKIIINDYGLKNNSGFTLIEISIVIVIIALIVGGILVGQDLIDTAKTRAQISQIEKYQTAIRTFQVKYDYLPGDIPDPAASQFGFTHRGTLPGQGDGNGIIEGSHAGSNDGSLVDEGEQGMIWVDLTSANGLNVNLIDGNFSSATPTSVPSTISGQMLNNYFPVAKIGQGNYIYVFSVGFGQSSYQNYFGIAAPVSIATQMTANPGLTVKQAYDIDKKIDDGFPQLGRIRALFLNVASGYVSAIWAGTSPATSGNAYTTATSASSTSCFDNSTNTSNIGVGGNTQHYSIEFNGGSGINCALSVQFQ